MWCAALWMSTCVRFILLDSRQHPIKLARGYLAPAEFTNAASVHLQRTATIGTIQVGSRGRRLRLSIADKCPVFRPAAQILVRAADDLSGLVGSVVVTLCPDAQRNGVVERVFLDLHRLHRGDCDLVKNVAQSLSLVGIDPVLMHLE